MGDNRLFASNHAIGKKGYFFNMILLFGITYATNWSFANYFIPNTTSETYAYIARFIEYFIYLIYIITFFSLLDRRLFDIAGDRRNESYKNISSILKFCIFAQIVVYISANTQFTLPIPNEIQHQISQALAILFVIIVFVLGLLKGNITELTYKEYEEKKKKHQQ